MIGISPPKSWKVFLALTISLLIIGASLISVPENAYDQASQRILSLSNYPSGVTLRDIAWKETDYSYAIAVGSDSTGYGVVYRYWSLNSTWNQIWTAGNGELITDVVYDTYANNDTFLIVADNGGESSAYVIYDANGDTPVVRDLGSPPPGAGYNGAYFDPFTGPQGTLIAVGTPYNTVNGIITWHDMSTDGDVWSYLYVPKGEILEAVSMSHDSSYPILIAVGHNDTSGQAIAYAFDYEKLTKLSVPADAKAFYGIDWPASRDYGLVVGEDSDAHGRVWKMSLYNTAHISYYNSTSGSESLKYAYYNGLTWHTYTVDNAPYAGYYTSIALDSHNFPHISYWDGGTTYLKHAYYNGSAWNIEIVDSSGNVGQYSSIAIDKNDNIYISYYDSTNQDLKCAIKSGGVWNISTVDSIGDAGKYSSIAVDTAGIVHISYYDALNGYLKHAWRDIDGTWQTETVDFETSSDNGWYTSIALDSLNNPHISYYCNNYNTLRYASFNGSAWSIESNVAEGSTYTSLVIDSNDFAHISYINGGLNYIKKEGSWSSPVNIDSSGNYKTSIDLDMRENPSISFYDAANSDLKFALFDGSSWHVDTIDSSGSVGMYSSLVMGFDARFERMKVDIDSPVLRDVDWDKNGNGAVIVGDNGTVYVYYASNLRVYDWSSSGISTDFLGVGIKSPDSPGYGVAVGTLSGAKISYQIYNTSTAIRADSVKPHLNEIRLEDKNNIDRTNQQIDVGSYYYFFINGSYALGWDKVEIDIYGWYDGGIETNQYNSTPGANTNFHLHYQPDTADPYNNSGTWTLLWPDPSNPTITLGNCTQQVVDNIAGGIPGQNDGQDFYLLWANITFHEQVRYAPGDGTWNPSTNQSDASASFNDADSWNFNITIRDVVNGTSETKYDEFGIYIYTEISVYNNPAGTGAPGSTVYLKPNSHVEVEANRDYAVMVNITDLKNATGDRIILKTSVEVRNPTANNDTAASYIWTWRHFSPSAPLYVWGNNSTGTSMPPLDYGTYSAGYTYGYDPSTTYTAIEWRITIPPTTPDDEYTAVVSFEISY